MKVSFENNTLTVVTALTKEVIERGIGKLIATDEKGNGLYGIAVSNTGTGAISEIGLTCNAFVEDKAAFIQVLPVGTTLESVQKQYGDALLAAQKYVPQIVAAADNKAAAIADLFA